jgi:hypothetical protein
MFFHFGNLKWARKSGGNSVFQVEKVDDWVQRISP